MHHIDVRLEKDVYDANSTLAEENARHLKSIMSGHSTCSGDWLR